MVKVAMDTARGLLMPRPTTAATVTAAMDTARGPLMPTTEATAMEAMAATAMARGPLMPTTAVAMAVTAMAVMAMASKSQSSPPPKTFFPTNLKLLYHELNQIPYKYSFQ